MRNYIVKFMDKTCLQVTAKEAAGIAQAWKAGSKAIMIRGNLKATHQIASIDRVSRDDEKDLCAMAGIPLSEAPTMDKFLTTSQKLLE